MSNDRSNAKPTVLHVISGLGTGGAEMMLCRVLVRARHTRHEVVSLQGADGIGERLRAAAIDVSALGLPSPLAILRVPGIVARLSGPSRPALVQGWMTHGNLAATALAAIARVPLLWNVRQSLVDARCEKPMTRGFLAMTARLSRRPCRILYNSVAGASQHEAIGYPRSLRTIIPNGFDLASLRPDPRSRLEVRNRLGYGAEDVVVGAISRFHPMKNHAGIFESIARLRGAYPNLRLLLAGAGTDGSDVQSLVDAAGLTAITTALGNRDDIPELTRSLDIAVNLSVHGEGFPNVVGEAMASGVPCIVSDIGDSAWVVGDTGLVVPLGDVAAAAAALTKLLDMTPGERTELGQRGRSRIVAEFQIDDIVDHYEQLYLQTIEQTA